MKHVFQNRCNNCFHLHPKFGEEPQIAPTPTPTPTRVKSQPKSKPKPNPKPNPKPKLEPKAEPEYRPESEPEPPYVEPEPEPNPQLDPESDEASKSRHVHFEESYEEYEDDYYEEDYAQDDQAELAEETPELSKKEKILKRSGAIMIMPMPQAQSSTDAQDKPSAPKTDPHARKKKKKSKAQGDAQDIDPMDQMPDEDAPVLTQSTSDPGYSDEEYQSEYADDYQDRDGLGGRQVCCVWLRNGSSSERLTLHKHSNEYSCSFNKAIAPPHHHTTAVCHYHVCAVIRHGTHNFTQAHLRCSDNLILLQVRTSASFYVLKYKLSRKHM